MPGGDGAEPVDMEPITALAYHDLEHMTGRLHMDAGTRGRYTEYGQGIGSVLDTAWVRKCQALEAPAVLSRLCFYLCQRFLWVFRQMIFSSPQVQALPCKLTSYG